MQFLFCTKKKMKKTQNERKNNGNDCQELIKIENLIESDLAKRGGEEEEANIIH